MSRGYPQQENSSGRNRGYEYDEYAYSDESYGSDAGYADDGYAQDGYDYGEYDEYAEYGDYAQGQDDDQYDYGYGDIYVEDDPAYIADRPKSTSNRSAGNSGEKKNLIRNICCCVVSVLLVVANVLTTTAFSMLDNVSTISDSIVEDSRVSGSELVELDKEFAVSETDIESESDLGLPTDYIVSTDDVSLILLVGSDSRLGVSKSARSDSMMIVAIDRKHKKIKIVSIMRDLFAIIPNYKNHRFNQAFYYDSRYGNLDLKITFSTIKKNLGIQMEDYVTIDFGGFKKVIDLLGGVTLDVTANEAKYMCSHEDYGLYKRFSAGAGTYTMNGAETLNYCRMRKVGNGDFERTERQRKVLTQIVNQLKGSDVNTLYNIAMQCMESVVTNIPKEEIIGYAMEAVDILGYEIVQLRIPIEGSYVYSSVYEGTTRMSVLWPNYTWNAARLKDFIYNDKMTYANGKKATDVTIPFLPAGTITSLEPESPSDMTTTGSDTSITDTTSSSGVSQPSSPSTAPTSPSSEPSTPASEPSTAATTTTTTTTTTAAPTTTTTAAPPPAAEETPAA